MVNRYQRDKSYIVSELKKENRILRAEIKRLNRMLRTYSSAQSMQKGAVGSLSGQLFYSQRSEHLILSASSYPKYLSLKIKRASMVESLKRASGYFRKFRVFSAVMRAIYSVAAIIGTGAFFIFISGTLLFLIPIALIFGLSLYIYSMLRRKEALKKISLLIKNKDVYILFAPRGRPFEKGSCFMSTVKILSEKKGYVIIVSPYFVSGKGFLYDRFYPVARFESSNICIIRKYAFFALRSRILSAEASRASYIY